jgi:hypothetical protein
MTRLRRAPREIYRVYSEEEYLSGAGTELGAESELASAGERHFHRAAGVTMLVGVAGAVGAIVVLNGAWVRASAGGGPEGLLAGVHSGVTRIPVVAAPPTATLPPAVFHPEGKTRPTIRRARQRPGSSGLHPPISRSARPRGNVAVAVDYVPVPGSTPMVSSAAGAPPEAPPARAATPEKRPEFGFER